MIKDLPWISVKEAFPPSDMDIYAYWRGDIYETTIYGPKIEKVVFTHWLPRELFLEMTK